MTTSFLELATTLKYLGAKWLPEQKLILRPENAVKLTVSKIGTRIMVRVVTKYGVSSAHAK